jgi:hypothetical protein
MELPFIKTRVTKPLPKGKRHIKAVREKLSIEKSGVVGVSRTNRDGPNKRPAYHVTQICGKV